MVHVRMYEKFTFIIVYIYVYVTGNTGQGNQQPYCGQKRIIR